MISVCNHEFIERDRRYRVLKLSPELMFAGLLKPALRERPNGGKEIVALTWEGLPEDARIESAGYNELERLFYLIVRSASFEEVTWPIPELNLTITSHTFPVSVRENWELVEIHR